MKKLLAICLLVTNVSLGQSKQQMFANFRTNIPIYASAASLLLTQAKVDPIITDLIGRVLPKVADENVEAAVGGGI